MADSWRLTAPRSHHQFQPDILQVDRWFPLDTLVPLRASGFATNRDDVADGKDPGVWGESSPSTSTPKPT